MTLGSGIRDDTLREDDRFFRAVAQVREALHGEPVTGPGESSPGDDRRSGDDPLAPDETTTIPVRILARGSIPRSCCPRSPSA